MKRSYLSVEIRAKGMEMVPMGFKIASILTSLGGGTGTGAVGGEWGAGAGGTKPDDALGRMGYVGCCCGLRYIYGAYDTGCGRNGYAGTERRVHIRIFM